MRLYWKNTASDGLWSTVANWYEDASATVPHGSAPVSGDSVSYATGETAPLTIDMTVDLGAGVCNIAGIQVGTISDPASGVIAGGTFTGNSLYLAGNHGQFGSIFGGVFTGDGYNLSGYVYGGLFTGHDHSDDASQAGIFGGIFTGAKFWHNGRIAGGVFAGSNFTINDGAALISGGLFASVGFDMGAYTQEFTGGLWLKSGTLNVGVTIINGAGPSPSPAFTEIHGYGDIFGTSLL